MARPTKPLSLVKGHRTKEEKAVREKAESELLTGAQLKESGDVKNNRLAHKEFTRIKKLLKAIGKNDDLYGAAINTHCLLMAEEQEFLERKERFEKSIQELEEIHDKGEIAGLEYIQTKMALQGHILACDKAIMNKRKLMLSISKENIMTIQSALRSIPKKEQKKAESPMEAFLRKRSGSNA